MKVVAATDWGLEALAACFTAAFDGYLAGSFVMDAVSLPRFIARQGADLRFSRCVVDDDGALVALCFVGEFAAAGARTCRPDQVSGHALANADPASTLWRIGRGLLQFSETARDVWRSACSTTSIRPSTMRAACWPR